MPIYTLADLNKAKSKKPAGPAKQKAVAKPRTPIKLPSTIHTMSSPTTKQETAEKGSNITAMTGLTLSGIVPAQYSRSGRKLSGRTLSASDAAEGMQLDAAEAAAVDPFYDPGRTLADVSTDDDDDSSEEERKKKRKARRAGRKRGKANKSRKKNAKGKGEDEEQADQMVLDYGNLPMEVDGGLSEAETIIEGAME